MSNDVLTGQPVADTLYGGDGADTITGLAGSDLIYGGDGGQGGIQGDTNQIPGGPDNDTLHVATAAVTSSTPTSAASGTGPRSMASDEAGQLAPTVRTPISRRPAAGRSSTAATGSTICRRPIWPRARSTAALATIRCPSGPRAATTTSRSAPAMTSCASSVSSSHHQRARYRDSERLRPEPGLLQCHAMAGVCLLPSQHRQVPSSTMAICASSSVGSRHRAAGRLQRRRRPMAERDHLQERPGVGLQLGGRRRIRPGRRGRCDRRRSGP